MDLSLIPSEDLVRELVRRFNVEVIVAMDHIAALDYFEGDYDAERPEPKTPRV